MGKRAEEGETVKARQVAADVLDPKCSPVQRLGENTQLIRARCTMVKLFIDIFSGYGSGY